MKVLLPDPENPYIKNQLIAYIGNKRRLLGFLGEVFSELADRCPGSGILRFGDCFSGSGSVSRLAKLMGFSVASNDWELYSKIINTVHIGLSVGELDGLFSAEKSVNRRYPGGFKELLCELNGLSQPAESERYISRFYAPQQTVSADYRYERLFYTSENALFIDAVRNRIEKWFPGWDLPAEDFTRKCALLAPLLYQAATHANTNGVFKAYHKGFGGHGGDALTRIMAPMKLQAPLLADAVSGRRYDVECTDAVEFAAAYTGRKSFDICYLDPPYNQHQYGSNYFMLNTIALWDKPDVPMERDTDGKLRIKAGIRPDWTETKSGFCYRKTAPSELKRLLENIDARFIVLSYNTEGIIPFNELFEILNSSGKTEIFCRDYIIYRGGKQSLGRSNRNVEFQLVLSRKEQPGKSDREAVIRILLIRSVISLMNEAFVPARLIKEFSCIDGNVELVRSVSGKTSGISADTEMYYRFINIPEIKNLESLSLSEIKRLHDKLEKCRCTDRREEASVLISMIRSCSVGGNELTLGRYMRLWNSLFRIVRKFAFRKYRKTFEDVLIEIKRLVAEEEAAGKISNRKTLERKVCELEKVAQLRFWG